MNAQKIIILAAYFLTALIVVSATKGYYSNNKKSNERPFMMGMRYGRADRRMNKGGGGGGSKHVIVAPRNDKFFLASRYGKRSGGGASITAKNQPLIYPVTPLCANNDDLTCTYTGVSNIYRCIQGYGRKTTQTTFI